MVERKKLKYDKWFIVILGIILYSLMTQLWGLGAQIPSDPTNLNLWLRLAACGLAVYGDIWVFRIYIGSIKKQASKMAKLEAQLKDNPELKEIVNDILKG